MEAERLTDEELVALLGEVGRESYHHKHPFHLRMLEGALSPDEVKCWILNRFYYQKHIPVKDAIILSKMPGPAERRLWLRRIVNHDGVREGEGGVDAWLRFGEAAGINREIMRDELAMLPGVRFAVEAYVNFCRNSHWVESVASSLTEMFAPDIIAARIEALESKYPWIDHEGMAYFKARLEEAPLEAEQALELVLANADTADMQERVVAALRFKCQVLWSMLDAIELGHSRSAGADGGTA